MASMEDPLLARVGESNYEHAKSMREAYKSGRIDPSLMTIQCEICFNRKGNILRCEKCRIACYCSKTCQKYGWKELGHKEECKHLKYTSLLRRKFHTSTLYREIVEESRDWIKSCHGKVREDSIQNEDIAELMEKTDACIERMTPLHEEFPPKKYVVLYKEQRDTNRILRVTEAGTGDSKNLTIPGCLTFLHQLASMLHEISGDFELALQHSESARKYWRVTNSLVKNKPFTKKNVKKMIKKGQVQVMTIDLFGRLPKLKDLGSMDFTYDLPVSVSMLARQHAKLLIKVERFDEAKKILKGVWANYKFWLNWSLDSPERHHEMYGTFRTVQMLLKATGHPDYEFNLRGAESIPMKVRFCGKIVVLNVE